MGEVPHLGADFGPVQDDEGKGGRLHLAGERLELVRVALDELDAFPQLWILGQGTKLGIGVEAAFAPAAGAAAVSASP